MAIPQTPGEWVALAVGITAVLTLGVLPVIHFFLLDRQPNTTQERTR